MRTIRVFCLKVISNIIKNYVRDWGISMNEINELLQQIITLIKDNDIQGYKSMLFLINQVSQSQDKELLDSILMVLGELFLRTQNLLLA